MHKMQPGHCKRTRQKKKRTERCMVAVEEVNRWIVSGDETKEWKLFFFHLNGSGNMAKQKTFSTSPSIMNAIEDIKSERKMYRMTTTATETQRETLNLNTFSNVFAM